jgi:nucleotide-binding universal stress UspA family protein
MAQIENILFPVDFSPSCLAMAGYVKRAATLLGAGVSLVHIVDPAGYNALRTGLELYLLRPMAEVSEEHVAIGRERLDSFLTTDFPTAEYPRILASGDAATEIARVAKDGGFNLIIMPTHSGMFRQMLLGSTTAKVVNDADCPVLTSRHAETVAPRAPGIIMRSWPQFRFRKSSSLCYRDRSRSSCQTHNHPCAARRSIGTAR